MNPRRRLQPGVGSKLVHVLVAVGLVLALMQLFVHGVVFAQDSTPPPPAPAASPTGSTLTPSVGSTTTSNGSPLLQLRVVSSRPDAPGYQRSCKKGHACVFGPAWTDDNNAPQGHDGCDTQSNVLKSQLVDVTIKPGTHGCVVLSGVLHDPYTGATVRYVRGGRSGIQVDHVYPLKPAWDMGAALWPLQRRIDFANDPRNLIVTTALMNGNTRDVGKSDQTPSTWLPPTRAGRCRYVNQYQEIARAYGLPITTADYAALTQATAACSRPGGTR